MSFLRTEADRRKECCIVRTLSCTSAGSIPRKWFRWDGRCNIYIMRLRKGMLVRHWLWPCRTPWTRGWEESLKKSQEIMRRLWLNSRGGFQKCFNSFVSDGMKRVSFFPLGLNIADWGLCRAHNGKYFVKVSSRGKKK
mmetsp:Transcript_26814/g.61729  ORF Transcript_26814/g.61729 Transcript_26814/m.61729 type:complete len:138 (+) Transcript_26814:75-488(+)